MESSVPTYIVLTAIRFEKLDNIRVLNLKDGNEGWFILEDYQLPLPVNNIIPIIPMLCTTINFSSSWLCNILWK